MQKLQILPEPNAWADTERVHLNSIAMVSKIAINVGTFVLKTQHVSFQQDQHGVLSIILYVRFAKIKPS